MRSRWTRFGFAPPFGFWFRSPWRFPRRQECLRMLEEDLAEVESQIERMKRTDEED